MPYMIISAPDGAQDARTLEQVRRFHRRLAETGQLALALEIAPGEKVASLALSADSAAHAISAAPGKDLLGGFAILNAASKQEALDATARWSADLPGIRFEVRETGCPAECEPVPVAAVQDLPRFLVLLRSDQRTESDHIPPRAVIERLDAFNAAQVSAGALLAAEGLKGSRQSTRLQRKGDQLSQTDGPFTEIKELIAGYWLVQADDLDAAIAWARTVPYPIAPDVELAIRQCA